MKDSARFEKNTRRVQNWLKAFLMGGIIGLGFVSTAQSGIVLQQQFLDNYTWFSSYSNGSASAEAADDFTIVGDIDRLTFNGRIWSGTAIQQVIVRFYDANPAGGPGNLLREYLTNSGDANLRVSYDWVDVVLPTVFSATGKHFVSAQIVTDSTWETGSANTSVSRVINGERAYTRADNGTWSIVSTKADLAFTLYGTSTGQPLATGLSTNSTTRNGYFEVLGSAFGDSGQVIVGGVPAHIALWTNYRIKAYADNATPLGDNAVVVETINGSSAPLTLSVAEQISSGRINWQFRLVGSYSMESPEVGPDGNIYSVDVSGYLYSLTPAGVLRWVRAAGANGFDVAPDGRIYSMNSQFVFAHNANGDLLWRYAMPAYAYRAFDVAVGPDGNIYVGTSSDFGIFALDPAGNLLWNTPLPADASHEESGYEMTFGYNGSNLQVYIDTGRGVRAYSSRGNFLFSAAGNGPTVSASQALHTRSGIYLPDGTRTCFLLDGYNGFTVSSSQIHWGYRLDMIGYDESCNETDRFALPQYANQWPRFDSAETFMLLGSTVNGQQVSYAIDSRNGSQLWQQTYPLVEGQEQWVQSNAVLASDNSSAYFHTGTSGAVIRGFLTALNTATTNGGGNTDPTPTPTPTPTPNAAPVAVDDSVEMLQKTSLKVDVLANDSDPEGDTMVIGVVATDANLNVQVNTDQTLMIKPNRSFFGTSTFTYNVIDSAGNVSNNATVTVVVIEDTSKPGKKR